MNMLNWLKQGFWIFFFLGLGQLVSFFIGGFYPGCFLGMVLLFFSLLSGIFKKENIEGLSKLVLKHWSLYLLPFTVGIAFELGKVIPCLFPILIALLVSSISVVATIGAVAQFLENRWRKNNVV